MQVFTTSPLEDPRDVRDLYPRLEEIGYDGVFSFEAKHDPFIALAVAAEHTTRVRLGTAIAIAFARNPMSLAYLGNDLQLVTGGRFVLGLGSQVRPHVVNRYSSVWSEPAWRMREMIVARDAIFTSWERGRACLSFEGDFYRHTLMIPAFDPGPNPFGRPPVHVGGFGPRMVEVAGEVADGLITHPFSTRRSLDGHETARVGAGPRRLSGRSRAEVHVTCATLVVTAERDEELERLKRVARRQLALTARRPRTRPTLECHGWGALHPELNALSKQGRWDEMADLVDDAVLESGRGGGIAGVGRVGTARPPRRHRGCREPHQQPRPDPDHWAGIVADLKRRADPGGQRAWAVGPGHGHLVVATGVLRADLRHPVEEHAQRNASFEAGEAGAGTDVRAAAEREVSARVGAVEAELVGIVEHGFVAVGREETEGDLVARAQVLAVQLPILHAVAQEEADGWIVPERLLDRRGHEVGFGPQALEEHRSLATVHSRFAIRWRVVSLPEMKRNTSWVRASTSVSTRPSTSLCRSRVTKSSRGWRDAQR